MFAGGVLHITPPHPDRHDAGRRAELRDPESEGYSWHRGIRPKWASVPAAGGRYEHTNWLNTATFLTDVTHHDDGATAFLSGSNTAELGDLDDDILAVGRMSAKDGFKTKHEEMEGKVLSDAEKRGLPAAAVVGLHDQVPDWPACLARQHHSVCKKGTVVFFSEATIHSGMAVLSERTRYAMFNSFMPPWWKPHDLPASAATVERATGELKEILGFAHESSVNVGHWNSRPWDAGAPKL
jgi:ectoine hydroxylase-related dioxygenase (phytanoyl-CoA dioxygenase family)